MQVHSNEGWTHSTAVQLLWPGLARLYQSETVCCVKWLLPRKDTRDTTTILYVYIIDFKMHTHELDNDSEGSL